MAARGFCLKSEPGLLATLFKILSGTSLLSIRPKLLHLAHLPLQPHLPDLSHIHAFILQTCQTVSRAIIPSCAVPSAWNAITYPCSEKFQCPRVVLGTGCICSVSICWMNDGSYSSSSPSFNVCSSRQPTWPALELPASPMY